MTLCTGCSEWFHVACVQVQKKFIASRKLDWFVLLVHARTVAHDTG